MLDRKRHYYQNQIGVLNKKSMTFKTQRNSTNATTKELQRVVNQANNNLIILKEVSDYDDNIKKSNAYNKEVDWFVYKNIDEILSFFSVEKEMYTSELYSKMFKVYSNRFAIEKKIEEYLHYNCVKKIMYENFYKYKLDIWSIRNPHTNISISLTDYMDLEKRKEFNIIA